jgi:hypothetical protein
MGMGTIIEVVGMGVTITEAEVMAMEVAMEEGDGIRCTVLRHA